MSFTVNLRDYPETSRISWEYGDGGVTPTMMTSVGQTVSHEYARAGTYNVVVHLFDGGDAVNQTAPRQIAIGMLPVAVQGANASPIASFQILDVTSDNNQVLAETKRFTAAASHDSDGSIATYAWDFGDGSTDQGVSVRHTFPTGGRYTITLTLTDDRGGTAVATRSLLVNAAPTASFSFDVAPSDNLTVSFNAGASADTDGNITQYRWDFGDSTVEGSGQTTTHTYGAAGTYTVKLTVIDNNGATATTTQSVHASGLAVLVNSVNPAVGVVGNTVNGVTIQGENFAQGATVGLEKGAQTVAGTSVNVTSATQLTVDFDLHGAALGDYDVVVTPPGQTAGRLAAGFRVASANHVRLKTTMGDILFELVSDAPITTANFVQYVDAKFYDGTIFHRVVPGFVVQGGGFRPGLVVPPGLRGPIQNEFSPSRSNVRATVAMAKQNGEPNSATSQFFVNLADNSTNLDNQNGGFTVFARVTEGMDVVDAIAAVPLNGDQPVTDVIVNKALRE